jgi:hypothetical protein
VTAKGFKKYYISNAVDGTENSMLWNVTAKDGKMRSECKEYEGTECENGDSDNEW